MLLHLRGLSGGRVSDDVLRMLFLEQLPERVRVVLAVSETGDLTKLAKQADRILEAAQNTISSVDSAASRNAETAPIRELTMQVKALTKRLNMDCDCSGNNRRAGRTTTETESRYVDHGFCFYHAKFGHKARNCRSPCSFRKAPRSLNTNRPREN